MAIKYKRIAERLEALIEKNIQNGIPKLPTEQELCTKYHVSRQTIRMALNMLEQKGLITKKQGSGSYLTGITTAPHGNEIGILITSDQEYIYPGVLHDIQTALSARSFTSRIYPTDNQISKERDILLALLKNPPRGLIAEGCKTALPNPNLDLYRHLAKKGCPTVFLFNHYPGLPDSLCIKDDNYSGSALLVRHLTSLGHTSIGAIFKSDDLQGIERYQGFIETMRDQNLPLPDDHIRWFTTHDQNQLLEKKDTAFLEKIIRESLTSCTAVICYNDLIAYYLTDELLRFGFHLPEDMAIAAFDNTYFSASDRLTITTLTHAPHEMGTKAAETLLKKLSGLPVSSQEARWKITIKESTSQN